MDLLSRFVFAGVVTGVPNYRPGRAVTLRFRLILIP